MEILTILKISIKLFVHLSLSIRLFSGYDIFVVSDICIVTYCFKQCCGTPQTDFILGKKTIPKKQAHINILKDIYTLRKTVTSFLLIVKMCDSASERKIQFYSEETDYSVHKRLTDLSLLLVSPFRFSEYSYKR